MGVKAQLNASAPDDKLVAILLNRPPDVRAKMVFDLLLGNAGNPAGLQALLAAVFRQMEAQPGGAELNELKARYEQGLAELEGGPVRPSTFIAEADEAFPG